MKACRFLFTVILGLVLSGLVSLGWSPIQASLAASPAEATLTGWLTIIWVEGKPGATPAFEIYTLTDDSGQSTQLRLNEALVERGDVLALQGQRVIVEGEWAKASTSGAGAAILEIHSLRLDPAAISQADLTASAVLTGPKPWITILCKFQGVAAEPKPLSYFQGLFANSYPGLDHYWRELSYNTISLAGSSAVGWFTLPRPKSYYVYDRDGDGQVEPDSVRLGTDCTAVADAVVNFSPYYGINLIFNSDLNSPPFGGVISRLLTLDGVSDFWPMTWIPVEDASAGVVAHEMGHGFRLGHTYVKDLFFISFLDLMGTPCAYAVNDPVYGCVSFHISTAYKDFLGWIPAGQKFVAPLSSSTTITLEQVALPQTSNYKLAQIPIGELSSRFYTVEARRKAGYDTPFPGEAVLIHEVTYRTSTSSPIVDLIPSDSVNEPGGDGALWTPGETFIDASNHITVSVISASPTGFVINIVNNSQGHKFYLPAILK